MKTRLKIALAATAVTAITGGTVVATVPAAMAAATGYGTVATRGVSLSVNDAPRLQSNRRGWVRPGQRVKISCQVYGDWVDGKWGRTNLWDFVDGLGYASDGWVDTGTNGRVTGVPLCGQQGARPTQPPRQTTAPQGGTGYQYPFTGTFHLPFRQGTGYPVKQGPGGSFSHYDRWNLHAVDFGTPLNTPLYAPGPGKIRYAGWDTTGYGYKLLIDHGNNRCTIMGHLNGFDVRAGDRVTTGQLVGRSGTTGRSSGPHLHYDIIRCDNGDSLETPNTYEAGRSYPLERTITSTNPTR